MIGYLVFLIISTSIYALFSLGLNLQWGFTGLLNFGHVAFLTIGAYSTVVLSKPGFLKAMPQRFIEQYFKESCPTGEPGLPLCQALLQVQNFLPEQVPLVIAVAIGAGLAAFVGLLIGLSTLRLRADYLGIVTIGVSEVVRLIAVNEEWLTGGSLGVSNYPLPLGDLTRPTLISKLGMAGWWTIVLGLAAWQLWRWFRRQQRAAAANSLVISPIVGGIGAFLFGLAVYGTGILAIVTDYSYKVGLMVILVTVLALVYWRLEVLVRSPWGRVLKAIREDEEVPKALGKNVFWYKLQSLMLGGAIASIAGAFYAWNLTFINPDGFIPLMTFYAWTIVILGGAGSNVGTILGAVIYWAYYSITRFALPALAELFRTAIPILPASLSDAWIDAFRLMVIGLLLVVLMMVRPQGILGKKEELTLGR